MTKLMSSKYATQIFADIKPLSKLPTDYLFRSVFVNYMCSIEWLVKKSNVMIDTMKKTLNPTICQKILKPTIYKQFAVEPDPIEISEVSQSMKRNNLNPLLMVSLEEPVCKALTINQELHNLYQKNCALLLSCLKYTKEFQIEVPLMQLKLTGLMPQEVIKTLSLLYMKEKMDDCTLLPDKIVNSMATMLSIGNIDSHFQTLLDRNLSVHEKTFFLEYLIAGMHLLKSICNLAEELEIRLLVDAEYSDINDGLSCITLAMASLYNHRHCTVGNTYQCYLREADQKLTSELRYIQNLGLYFGSKIVRGAYMFWENNKAKERGIQSAVLDSYESTSLMYSKVADTLLSKINADEEDKVSVLFATQNRNSVQSILKGVSQMDINKRSMVSFAQLYGLSDSLSLNLAAINERSIPQFRVYKSIAVGSLLETLPYLARRATDNCDIFSSANIERQLLIKALKYKLIG